MKDKRASKLTVSHETLRNLTSHKKSEADGPRGTAVPPLCQPCSMNHQARKRAA